MLYKYIAQAGEQTSGVKQGKKYIFFIFQNIL